MVQSVRKGEALRRVARATGLHVASVNCANDTPGRAWNRTPASVETRILRTRVTWRTRSVLGAYGADAITAALGENSERPAVVLRSTITRVLERRGALDTAHRPRRPAPPQGWYLPDLARAEVAMDRFDFIVDLKIADGPLVSLLTGISLHGALAEAWVMPERRTTTTVSALLARGNAWGLPAYAQCDNDTVCQGPHQCADRVGRVSRLCLALGVIPVCAPPREPGLQHAIEGWNALWQRKVWARHHCRNIAAHRNNTAHRRDAAAARRPFPTRVTFDPKAAWQGVMIFIRRSNERGSVNLLGRDDPVDKNWPHRLVRCEVSCTHCRIRVYALRRRDPEDHPLLHEVTYLQRNTPSKDNE